MGLVLPKPGYLEKLRELTKEHGTLLIFDEVMCGFKRSAVPRKSMAFSRTSPAWARSSAAGCRRAAYGGRRDIMSYVSPAGPVYQAGTLSGGQSAGYDRRAGNPAAHRGPGRPPAAHPSDHEAAEQLARQGCRSSKVAIQARQAGSMMGIFFQRCRGHRL